MELKFLGRGSAFNYKEGNTSSYFIENNKLFLIDCGSTIFRRIMNMNLLENIEKINIFITHTHTDHIGSLGTLIEYAYFNMNKKVNLILEENLKNINSIKEILNYCGVTREMYNVTYTKYIIGMYETFNKVSYIETRHTDTLNAYSLIFLTNNGVVFYSGDTNNATYLEYLLMTGTNFERIYIETTLNESSPVHLPLSKLSSLVPEELKSKVFCMHLESQECIEKVIENGFNVVEIEKSSRRLIKIK